MGVIDKTHVSPGQPLRIPAANQNAWTEAAAAHAEQQRGSGNPLGAGLDEATILVKNTTEQAVERFHALGLRDPLFDPGEDDQRPQFKDWVVFEGDTPQDVDAGQFAVLLEPAPPGRTVPAKVIGATIARIKVDDAEAAAVDLPDRADVVDGETILHASDDGMAEILWMQDGTQQDPLSERWAIIRLGGGSPPAVEFDAMVTGHHQIAAVDIPNHPYQWPVKFSEVSPEWDADAGLLIYAEKQNGRNSKDDQNNEDPDLAATNPIEQIHPAEYENHWRNPAIVIENAGTEITGWLVEDAANDDKLTLLLEQGTEQIQGTVGTGEDFADLDAIVNAINNNQNFDATARLAEGMVGDEDAGDLRQQEVIEIHEGQWWSLNLVCSAADGNCPCQAQPIGQINRAPLVQGTLVRIRQVRAKVQGEDETVTRNQIVGLLGVTANCPTCAPEDETAK